MGLILIDSNILIYAYDVREKTRQEQAFAVLKTLESIGSGRLSVQCLSEFFARSTRRPDPLMSISGAAEQTAHLANSFTVYPLTPQVVLEAVRGVREHHFSFWDAQIWAAARLNQVPVIFSENFSPGTRIDGIRFINPLSADFVLEDWVSR